MTIKTIQTLKNLHDEGWHCWAHCTGRNCGSASQMDITSLMKRFGAEHCFINEKRISARLVCSRCGHRGGRLSICAPSSAQLDH